MNDSFPIRVLVPTLAASFVLIFAVRSVRGAGQMNAVKVVLLGGGLTLLLYLGLGLVVYPASWSSFDIRGHYSFWMLGWLRNGLTWLLLYEALKYRQPRTVRQKLTWAFAVMAFSGFVAPPPFKLQTVFYSPAGYSFGSEQPWFPSIESVFRTVTQFPQNLQEAAYGLLVVWVSCAWLGGARDAQALGLDAVRARGLKGLNMSKFTDQSTRLLCASALMGHGDARNTIVGWFKDPNRAVALELGVDLRLAVQVARYAEARDRRYWWAYFGILVACLLTALIVGAVSVEGFYAVAIIGGLGAAAVWARKQMQERDQAVSMFWPEQFDPEKVAGRYPSDLQGEELSALPSPDQNFFVYGGFVPFVGAGHDLGGWSVAVALDKPKQGLGPSQPIRPFDIPQLYGAIDVGLDRLELSEIEKKDCYFASADIRADRSLLPEIFGRPVQFLDPEIAKRYLFKDDEKVRHYRCYRIVDWGGELAISYYLRCSRRGNTLFVETKRFLLTPLAASYRRVDNLVPMDLGDQFGVVVGGLIAGPLAAVASPFWVLGEFGRWFREFQDKEDKQRRELIEKNPMFNYGTVMSLRSALSSGEFGHYFQKIDGDLYSKLFEREVLDSLVEFLEECGIDTSDLRERQTTILNSGVIVHGGDVKAESLAVGTGAEAVKSVKQVSQRVLGRRAEAKGAGK